MLDLTRIRYFHAVAEAGSFSRAARRLGVSQPTLSIQIARLEDELGVPLFRRHHSGASLSEVGSRLFAQSAEILNRIAAMEASVRAEVEVPVGELRVGTINSVGIYLLPEALAVFSQRHPLVQPLVRFEHSGTVLDLLTEGEIDLAITAGAAPPVGVESVLLTDDPLVLVCGRGHRLWRRRLVRAADLKGERLITFDDQSPTGGVIERVLARHLVDMQVWIKTPQIAALIRMVRLNMALAFVPSMALADEVEAAALHVLHFPDSELHRGIFLSWRKPDEFAARAAFVDCLEAVVRRKVQRPV
ncbi:MAG: LysR family transcriptional regulator [Deltaproteobacteria bacterium]|nr:LysR family transcriptional regulator [Deltaproteobacteria bacterium]